MNSLFHVTYVWLFIDIRVIFMQMRSTQQVDHKFTLWQDFKSSPVLWEITDLATLPLTVFA